MRIQTCIALLGALALSSCTFARLEINDAQIPERIGNLQLGQDTEDDLIKAIGTPPGQIILLPNNKRLLIYNYGQSKTMGLTLVILNIAKTNVAIDTAIFLIDENDMVEEHWVGDNSVDVPWEWWAFGE